MTAMEIERKNARTIDLLKAKDTSIQKVYKIMIMMTIQMILLYSPGSRQELVLKWDTSWRNHSSKGQLPVEYNGHIYSVICYSTFDRMARQAELQASLGNRRRTTVHNKSHVIIG